MKQNKIDFRPRKRLSEYLEQNEIEQLKFNINKSTSVHTIYSPTEDDNKYFHNKILNDKDLRDFSEMKGPDLFQDKVNHLEFYVNGSKTWYSITYPNLEDNIFIYQKLINDKELKQVEPLEFFNLLYYHFTSVLKYYNDFYKAVYYSTPLVPDEYEYLRCFYYYSLGYLIYKHNVSRYPEKKLSTEANGREAYNDFLPDIKPCKNFTLSWIESEISLQYQSLAVKLGIMIEAPFEEYRPLEKDIKELGINLFKKGLSIDQIALIYHFSGRTITRANAEKVIKLYGWTSGEKLYQRFIFYQSSDNRMRGDTSKTISNKIKLLQSIIEYIDNSKKPDVLRELEVLKLSPNSKY